MINPVSRRGVADEVHTIAQGTDTQTRMAVPSHRRDRIRWSRDDVALVEREFVTKRGLLTEALTYTKLLPGSTVPQAIAYLGHKLGGWSGSALAITAFLLPSAVLMVLLAAAYVTMTALLAFGPHVNGLTAGVVGLLLATTYRLGKPSITEPLTWRIALEAFAAGAFLGVSAAAIVVAAGRRAATRRAPGRK
jgi:chromate transporter